MIPRPYYIHIGEERYQWFLFLQAELCHFGHYAFADQIAEIELEHYRELIVWQLQRRTFLAQRLYEIRDSIGLSVFKNLLARELTDLRSNPTLNLHFEKALDGLRVIDDNMKTENQPSIFNGVIILPWIDRHALDRRMGIERLHTPEPSQVIPPPESTFPPDWYWSTLREFAGERNVTDDEAEKMLKEMYQWILCYIRALAVMSEGFYTENNLKELTQLRSNIVGPAEMAARFLRRYSTADEQMISEFNMWSLVLHFFWPHLRERLGGGMTVGDIILPWVEVRDDWF